MERRVVPLLEVAEVRGGRCTIGQRHEAGWPGRAVPGGMGAAARDGADGAAACRPHSVPCAASAAGRVLHLPGRVHFRGPGGADRVRVSPGAVGCAAGRSVHPPEAFMPSRAYFCALTHPPIRPVLVKAPLPPAVYYAVGAAQPRVPAVLQDAAAGGARRRHCRRRRLGRAAPALEVCRRGHPRAALDLTLPAILPPCALCRMRT